METDTLRKVVENQLGCLASTRDLQISRVVIDTVDHYAWVQYVGEKWIRLLVHAEPLDLDDGWELSALVQGGIVTESQADAERAAQRKSEMDEIRKKEMSEARRLLAKYPELARDER